MEIITIFEGRLYAAKFLDNPDEFEKAFDSWSDIEYLLRFFEEHQEDLEAGFYNKITVYEAAQATLHEAALFENEILIACEKNQLDQLFRNLHHKLFFRLQIPKKKAYGTEVHSWLRIYALQIEDVYIITGSSIKLTKTMQERMHTKQELAKLAICSDYFKSESINSKEALLEIVI